MVVSPHRLHGRPQFHLLHVKTLGAILVSQRQPLVVDEVELPALRPGQVLVRLKATRLCGSQIGEIDGVKGPDRFLPHLLGHEAGGIVLETGPGVVHVASGDRVVCHWRPGAGCDAGASAYQWHGTRINAGPITTFQHLAVLSENRVTRVPQTTDFDLCCLLADTLTTGFGIVNRDARVAQSESVVIFGAGGIGLGVIIAARQAGAHPIIAVDLQDHKLQIALTHGASHTVNATRENPRERITALLGGPADVTIDGTGVPAVIETAYELARLRGGRCILYGVMPHDQRVSLHTLPLHFGRQLVGSEGGQSQPAKDIPALLTRITAGEFSVAHLVSHRAPLERVNDLITAMRQGEVRHGLIDLASVES
jgi:S-(hydroxymethyl)glutathione dehydrogenase/alcohol dehydrogenase